MNTLPPRILTERRERIFIVTINRPEARNAFDAATSWQMKDAMDEFEADPSLFVAVITGNGGTFCAGADLKEAATARRLWDHGPATE